MSHNYDTMMPKPETATHDLFVVAELLGHESVETTEHYVAMPDGRLREATAAVRLDV